MQKIILKHRIYFLRASSSYDAFEHGSFRFDPLRHRDGQILESTAMGDPWLGVDLTAFDEAEDMWEVTADGISAG